jgi:lipopolysaccharide heptosyltransferase I
MMRVAVVKLSALGDVVHAMPVAAAVRAGVPGARITWLVEARYAPILREHPALDDVIAIDTRRWRRARRPTDLARVLGEMAGLRHRLAAGQFDVALDLQGLVKSGVLTRATGAAVRAGFVASRCRERANALFTNRRIAPPPAARHVVDQNLSLLDAIGVPYLPQREFQVPHDVAADTAIEAFLAASGTKPGDRVVVINPGAARPEKRWPTERFAAVTRELLTGSHARVIVLWGPEEADTARAIARVGATLAPATDLPAMVALLRRASVVLSGDTGPLHVAAALGIRCVGLFGPTSAARNGPYGAGHRTLQAPDGAMTSLTVPAVVAAIAEVLG